MVPMLMALYFDLWIRDAVPTYDLIQLRLTLCFGQYLLVFVESEVLQIGLLHKSGLLHFA